MFHLTIRVAWHDSQWDATVCRNPTKNPYCLALERVRLGRIDAEEVRLAGKSWAELPQAKLPPCVMESAGFMNAQPWKREFVHPYQDNKNCVSSHGVLEPTTIEVPEYATFAVPYGWMLKSNQETIEKQSATMLPPDETAPFNTRWIFGRARQEALLDMMFGRLRPEESLVFFYCKEGQPLGDSLIRLVVGVGRIVNCSKLLPYKSKATHTYPLWDRIVRHSIRPDAFDGFLLPYHDYLVATGDPEEDERRASLLKDIAVPGDGDNIRTYSYGAELSTCDVALSTLVRCLESTRLVRKHGIAKGPWMQREEWLNEQISRMWRERGAFPGLGSALEALKMRLGTALSLELYAKGTIKPDDDPWPLISEILNGTQAPPQQAYVADLNAIRKSWMVVRDDPDRLALLKLLSRFSISPGQAKNWFDRTLRVRVTGGEISDAAIIENPYIIAERDLGDAKENSVSIGVIDRGVLPPDDIAAKHPVPKPSLVESRNDQRRLRGALVHVLREAADEGDSLLSIGESVQRMAKLDLEHPCDASDEWFAAQSAFLKGVVEQLAITVDPERDRSIPCVQLTDLKTTEERLKRVLEARAAAELPTLGADWAALLIESIKESGSTFDPKDQRHIDALADQAEALERITRRKLSVLVGRAGTGKSSALGGLVRCATLIAGGGILFLAPTGKARVRLSRAAGADAKTVAQFLYELKRYDGARQRPLFQGDVHRKERTVIIDECSMLTLTDLLAVILALDLVHVQRIVLVGDPNQLPPIGEGRPFADLVAMLEDAATSTIPEVQKLHGAYGRLRVEVRATESGRSDTLRLASWFTREPQPPDADRVLSDLETGGSFNDLRIRFWKTLDDLHEELLTEMQSSLGLKDKNDVDGFNRRLGFVENLLPDLDAIGAESFQILSPVRMHAFGVYDLNRWMQKCFRSREVERARKWQNVKLGDEEITIRDKVIQLRNEWRDAYDMTTMKSTKLYLANGEIGLAVSSKNEYLNTVFAGRPGLTIGFRNREFKDGSGPLELAYALTVHKAQGSEFRTVFVVLPQSCGVLTRELIYTALTRSKDRLVLLIQGDNASSLYDYTRPERSETARRNSNLFRGAVRNEMGAQPYADHLIHKTLKGHLVRSKSELVIANLLFKEGVEYHYERVLEGTADGYRLRPDFSFMTPAGTLIVWEHLGMLSDDRYRSGWDWKRGWYERNGYVDGETLFTSKELDSGGLDSDELKAIADTIKALAL
jgi:hypothetical protein